MKAGSRLSGGGRADHAASPRRQAAAPARPTPTVMRSPSQVADLQRLVGNRAVTAMLPAAPVVQRVFTNETNLDGHYQKHGGEYPGQTKAQYNALSTTLWKQRNSLQSKTAANGRVYVYDPANNDFATFTPDGKAITVFKPSGGQSYYDKQV